MPWSFRFSNYSRGLYTHSKDSFLLKVGMSFPSPKKRDNLDHGTYVWLLIHLGCSLWITLPETNSSPMKIPSFLGFIPSKWWIFQPAMLVYRRVGTRHSNDFSVSTHQPSNFCRDPMAHLTSPCRHVRGWGDFGSPFHETQLARYLGSMKQTILSV